MAREDLKRVTAKNKPSREEMHERIGELQAQQVMDRGRITELEAAGVVHRAEIVQLEAQGVVDREVIDHLEGEGDLYRDLVTHLKAQGVLEQQRIANLEIALMSARRIGAAMGILMTSREMTDEQAFDALQTASKRRNCELHEVADDVILNGTLNVA